MSETIKPCPFCGGVTDVEIIEGSTYRWRVIRCKNCDVRITRATPEQESGE